MDLLYRWIEPLCSPFLTRTVPVGGHPLQIIPQALPSTSQSPAHRYGVRFSLYPTPDKECRLKPGIVLATMLLTVLHFRTVAQVFGVSIVGAIAHTMTTLVISTVPSILGRPSKLIFDHCGSQTRATGSRKRCHL